MIRLRTELSDELRQDCRSRSVFIPRPRKGFPVYPSKSASKGRQEKNDLPLFEKVIYFSSKQLHIENHIFGNKNKQKITFSATKTGKKSHFRKTVLGPS